jgi:hypothetical protein
MSKGFMGIDEYGVIGLCAILLVLLISTEKSRRALEAEAVSRGFAEWVVVEEGLVRLKWKEAK